MKVSEKILTAFSKLSKNIEDKNKSKNSNTDFNRHVVGRIQPAGGIKFEPNYVRLGDGYVTCLHLYKYQNIVNARWLDAIMNMNNVTCTLDIANANKKEVVSALNKAMAEQNSRFASAKEHVDRQDAQAIYSELQNLYKDISTGEFVKYVHVRLYVQGKTFEELEINTRTVMNELEAMNFRATIYLNEQEWEWESLFTSYNHQQNYQNKRKGKEIPVSTLAAGYPFHHTHLHDKTGTYFGTTYTNGTVLFDLFYKDSQRKHYNALMIGQMGSGKSTLLKKVVVDQAIQGNKIRILDVTGEFSDLVKSLGGIEVALDGSQGIINPLHVYKTAVKEDGTADEGISFMQHISKVKVFYKYLNTDVTEDEVNLFADLLLRLYIKKGLWSEGIEKVKVTEFKAEEYPTFSELATFIDEELYSDFDNKIIRSNLSQQTSNMYESISRSINSLVTIYGDIFDGHSSIQSFDDELVVSLPIRNLLSINTEVFQAQLFNILNLLWDGMILNGSHQLREFNKGNLTQRDAVKYLIVIDEAHNFINTTDIAKPAVKYIERFMREARKYFGGIFFVSHLISDFVPDGANSENANNVKKLFRLTQYKFIAQQDAETIPTLRKVFEGQITESELGEVPRLQTGHVLLSISGVKNILFKVDISKSELKTFGGGA